LAASLENNNANVPSALPRLGKQMQCRESASGTATDNGNRGTIL
jgi:hypothetical protein